ncbi:MAG: MBL fold metallo-hydrolase [Coriobacteriales bacterium]|jgi:7,8-dihydropterin-6-yl-methyl-4-(beta-D-ribofuranosyl)aminobenzene 5'-phosphate synthase
MRITALVENTTARAECTAEHGLALLVEANGRTVLFDSGQGAETLVANAAALGIDLASVEAAVLSHGHHDHSGGFNAFLDANDTAVVYGRKGCELPHFHGEKYIGIDAQLASNPRFHLLEGDFDLGHGFSIVSFAAEEPVVPIDSDNLEEEDHDGRHLEQFTHEQCLIVEEGASRVLISGCSHRGIVNYAHWTRELGITHFVGGFHLMRLPLESDRIAATAEALLAFPARYTTCHCTGSAQHRLLKRVMGDRLGYLSTGETLEIVE